MSLKTAAAGVAATATAAMTLLVGLSAPASADDSGYFPNSKPCKHGARYAVGWSNYGHWLFGRDCKADGWGIKVIAWYKDKPEVGGWGYIGEVWDHSSAGDGAWKNLAEIGPENRKVELEIWETRYGVDVHRVGAIIRDYHT